MCNIITMKHGSYPNSKAQVHRVQGQTLSEKFTGSSPGRFTFLVTKMTRTSIRSFEAGGGGRGQKRVKLVIMHRNMFRLTSDQYITEIRLLKVTITAERNTKNNTSELRKSIFRTVSS